MLNRIFKRQNRLAITNELMKEVVNQNRVSLTEIKTWVDEEAFRKSYFNYGVPDQIRPLLNLDIGNEVTYSDLILYLSNQLAKVNYLELGVSVGKNFFQMASGFSNASLTGFDVENMHPSIQNKFSFISNENWEGKPDSIRKELFSLSKYIYQTNTISYIAGDIWDENCWSKLIGNKYSIIFSDALHESEALFWEYKMIEKYELLNDKFLFVWDDLNNGLEKSFKKIGASLKEKYLLADENIRIIKINGWLGKNYPIKHDLGIITNLALK